MSQLLLKCFTIILAGLILTQCGEKMSAQNYVQEGIEYSNQERFDKARDSFLKAIEEDPKIIEGYYGLGGIYNLEKKYDDAEKAFKTAIQLDPTHYNAWYSLGYTYELMGKKEDSEKSYEKYRRLKGQMDSIMNREKP
jgi:Tfp pilus assembly protein PilF